MSSNGEQDEQTNIRFSFDSIMTKKRFQFIRKNYLCFRSDVSLADLKKDPVSRIRPLINMLKFTSPKYVLLVRNVAVEVSSIACRSKYGRHLIVYNASKRTWKFHFKIYAYCCATSWLMVVFRLHCSSDMEDRLSGVIAAKDAWYFDDRLPFSSSIRQIVLEVTRPLHGSKRVVNTDNFCTSVTLLLSLRDVGMYSRGIIRAGSAHFPKAHMFAKKAKERLSKTGQIVAASWMDGSAVNIISNADSSDMGAVTRKIGSKEISFPAPSYVSEYNAHMQGVDRLDHLHAMFSIADGHKKLALAFIDIARVNAYVTMCRNDDVDPRMNRDVHRQFMLDLSIQLITGKWKETVEDEDMLFSDEPITSTPSTTASPPRTPTAIRSPIPACEFVLAKLKFPDAT